MKGGGNSDMSDKKRKQIKDEVSEIMNFYSKNKTSFKKGRRGRRYAIEYGDDDTKISYENATAIYKGDITDEDLANLLREPEKNAKVLRSISKLFYYKMPVYMQLINYQASLEEWNYGLTPIYNPEDANQEEIKTKFLEVSKLLSRLIKKKILKQIKARALTFGAFCGYFIDKNNDRDFTLISFPLDFCKIVALRDGNYVYALDMKYFDKDPEFLESLPPIFSELYRENSGHGDRYAIIDDPNAICIKGDLLSETEILPTYVSLFPDLFDLADAKTKRMVGRIVENYKMLHLKMPIGDKRNEFLIDPKLLHDVYFYDASDVIPEEMGIIMNPMDAKVIDFSSNLDKGDDVAKVYNDVLNGAGVSTNLFNTSAQAVEGLDYSIKVDVAVNSFILDQIEDWVNAYLKNNGLGDLFKFELYDVTRFDRDKRIKEQLELGKYGFPNKLKTLYMSGLKPLELMATMDFENNVLGLATSFIPLSSSHTLSGTAKELKDEIDNEIESGESDETEN